MKISKSKSGRIIVELDGSSGFYQAKVQGALTGTISLPPEYGLVDEPGLHQIASLVLSPGSEFEDYKRYYGAVIVKKADRVW